MLPRVLSFLIPLFVYTALVFIAWGIHRERRRMDRWGLFLAAGAFVVSLAFRPNEHLLFFDEDIYIQIASNLAHAPVAQLTLFGGQKDIQSSTYYKEPAGFPVILSLIFAIFGVRESIAFVVSRALYALTVAAVYFLGREILKTRAQALTAAVAFAATPACLAFSASTGTDLPAALFAALGILGIVIGNSMLAAGGFAMAAQTRLEMIVLVLLILLAEHIQTKWKVAMFGLIVPEILHIAWVFSISPTLAKAEHVNSAFSPSFLWGNLTTNLRYLFDPRVFPVLVTVSAVAAAFVAIVSMAKIKKLTVIDRRYNRTFLILLVWLTSLFMVYLFFYAGSFAVNPRYSIQLTIPLILLAVSLSDHRIVLAAIAISAVIAVFRPWQLPTYVQALASDHHTAVDFAQKVGTNDLVISGEPEIFVNQGKTAMNTVFGSERVDLMRNQLGRFNRVFYYSGIRTNEIGTQQWEADREVKSDFELHLIDAKEFSGLRIAIYELLKPIHREGG